MKLVSTVSAVVVLAGLVLGLATPSTEAAPIIKLVLEGRVAGSTGWAAPANILDANPTAAWLGVKEGELLEYQVMAVFAPFGTKNNSTAGYTITALTAVTDGINSTTFNLWQAATQDIQVSFNDPATIPSNLTSGFSSPGVVKPRGGGMNDLLIVHPQADLGVYRGVTAANDRTPFLAASGSTGEVNFGANEGADSTISISGKTPPVTGFPTTYGGIKFHEGATGRTAATKTTDADQYWGYVDLNLYKRFALAEFSVPVNFDLNLNLDLDLHASVGGSSHTAVAYKWQLGGNIYTESDPDLTIPWAVLNAMGPGSHPVTLTVTPGDMLPQDGPAPSRMLTLELVPEPATMALLGLGMAIGLVRRRR